MRSPYRLALFFLAFFICTARAADYPAPKEADWVARDFRFHTGEVLAEVRLHYTTIGGNQALYRQAPSAARGNEIIAQRLAAPFTGDANDTLYQWESSADFDPSAGLEKVEAMLLAVNSSDDERNPPELGVMERELKRVRSARYLLIPGSPDTRGHGTTGMARLYKQELAKLLREAPQR